MKTNRGFTLIELMVTLAIVSVLATIALPTYKIYIQRSSILEATNGLQRMQINMEKVYQDNRSYYGSGACSANSLAPLPNTKNFTWSCYIPNTGWSYSITAMGTGPMEGFIYNLSHSEYSKRIIAPIIPPELLDNCGTGFGQAVCGKLFFADGGATTSIWTDYVKTTFSVPDGWVLHSPNMCWVTKPDGSC